MSSQKKTGDFILSPFAPFFEKALDIVPTGAGKLLVVLSVVILLAIALQEVHSFGILGFASLVIVGLVSLFLTFALNYYKAKLRYSKITEEELKKALRDMVLERQEQEKGSKHKGKRKKTKR